VVARLHELDRSAADSALLIAVLLSGLPELLLLLILLADVVLHTLVEHHLAAGACELAAGSILADSVGELGVRVCDVRRGVQELVAGWCAAVHAEPMDVSKHIGSLD
jgi:hypothetical protein